MRLVKETEDAMGNTEVAELQRARKIFEVDAREGAVSGEKRISKCQTW
jgi:hypothetical protein